MKTNYETVRIIQSRLDDTSRGGFARMANAYVSGNFDNRLAWSYLRNVHELPRELFGTFLHHFRVAVESELAWRNRGRPPFIVEDYLKGANVPGVRTDLRPLSAPNLL